MIEKGSHVRVYLKNSVQAEGFVESWSDDKLILTSENNLNKFIIFNIKENLVAVKLSLVEAGLEKYDIQSAPVNPDYLQKEFEETVAAPIEQSIKNKSLARLRIMMAEHDKKEAAENLKNHVVTTRQSQYGYPSFIKKQSTK